LQGGPRLVGAVIGNYQLVQRLGQGGMGAVYLGEHTLLGRRAAVKVLLPELSARPDAVNRFFNEARAVTSISDPGIVQVFDFGYHSDGSAFIVMEYLEGEALDRRLSRVGKLPVNRALRLGRQLASSLSAANAKHIIHRDLKPENIFLVPDAEVASGERAKILDFGIAKLSDDQPGLRSTVSGVVIGTPAYMSPEQCRGIARVDHRSDIYALGCVLFHALAGRPPFDGEGPGDIISAHIREPAVAPSSGAEEIPPHVDALVLRCLAKAPADRFQTMYELATALRQALQQDSAPHHAALTFQAPAAPMFAPAMTPKVPTTLVASSGQFAPPAPAPPRRGRWIAAGFAVGAVGIAIAIAVAATRGSGRSERVSPAASGASPIELPAVSAGSSPTPPIVGTAGSVVPEPPPKPPEPPRAPPEAVATRTTDGGGSSTEAPPRSNAPALRRDKAEPRPPRARTKPRVAEQPTVAPVVPPETSVAIAVTAIDAGAGPVLDVAPPSSVASVTAPAARGSFDAVPSIASLDVRGGLTKTVVQNSMGRLLQRLRACYAAAARESQATPAIDLQLSYEINEHGLATGVSTSGGLGSLGKCAAAATTGQRTQSPDVGTARVTALIRFSPT
jgi:eukaryotic-like serine/threonine-protein kinase